MRQNGFVGPKRIVVARGEVLNRASTKWSRRFSLSGSAPHLFGAELGTFEDELRGLLRASLPTGVFSERTRDIGVGVWWP